MKLQERGVTVRMDPWEDQEMAPEGGRGYIYSNSQVKGQSERLRKAPILKPGTRVHV